MPVARTEAESRTSTCGPRSAKRKVSADFAICPTEVVRNDDGLSGSMAGGYSRIPGYLIARLAIDTSLLGQGYGEQLLLDALGKAVAASEILRRRPAHCR